MYCFVWSYDILYSDSLLSKMKWKMYSVCVYVCMRGSICLLLGEKFDLHRNGEESSESNSSRIFHLCKEKKIKLRTFRFSTAAMNISCQSTSRYFTKIVCSAYRLLSTAHVFFFFFSVTN